jgi:hypothetical protein
VGCYANIGVRQCRMLPESDWLLRAVSDVALGSNIQLARRPK